MNKLSFKDYLASKTQLYTAIQKDPIHEVVYEVSKYCRLAVGETKEIKEYHNLKPKQQVIIEWCYSDIDELPEPISIKIPHLYESTSSIEPFKTFQTGERLLNWVRTNTTELS